MHGRQTTRIGAENSIFDVHISGGPPDGPMGPLMDSPMAMTKPAFRFFFFKENDLIVCETLQS